MEGAKRIFSKRAYGAPQVLPKDRYRRLCCLYGNPAAM